MSKMTLDDITNGVAQKYAGLEIEIGEDTVELRNPLRLGESGRKQLRDLVSKVKSNSEDEDAEDAATDQVTSTPSE